MVMEFRRHWGGGEGLEQYGITRASGIEHFGISLGMGVLMKMPPTVGYG